MIENVYFVENLHGIQCFLSLYEAEQSSLIVMGENKSLHQFLQEIMPNEKKIIIPKLNPYLYRPLKRLFYVFLYRMRYTRMLKGISASAKAYFFSKGGNVHFFILLGYLSRRGVEIKFIDLIYANFYEKRIQGLRLFPQVYLWVLSIAAGVRLAKFQARYWQHLGMANCVEQIAYRHKSWELLAKKYNWAYRNDTKNAILLVDGPIQTYPGVNVKETQKTFIRFFTQLVNKGLQIHLKPHYNAPEINSFNGTCLEEKIKILPAYFPVELILDQYQEIYFFCSVSGSTPIEGKKYSLAKLVVFNSKEKEDSFWKVCGDDFGEEISKVEFVRL